MSPTFELTMAILGFAGAGLGGLLILILKAMLDSVKSLNEKVGIVCEHVAGHEVRISHLETNKR